jgi:hypothetical protein
VRLALLLILFPACLAGTASAQTYQGAVRGQVRDQGGVVPGAQVSIVNEDTNALRSATSNEVGEYVFTSVLPGVYTVRAVLPGFKTEERRGVRIATQQSVVLDFVLQLGGVTEQITVTGGTPAVERSNATVASTLDKAMLESLPMFGRNTFYASITTPAVIQTGDPQFVRYQDQTNASYLSLGGGPRRGNAYLLEGVSITDLTNRPTIAPSAEALNDLKIQVKTYDADMGRAAGGVFNTAARSGSNQWHGSAVLVSKPGWGTGKLYFTKKAGLPNPPQYYYNWAGSLGGPIVRDKTFFWFSSDDYKQRSTRNNVLTFPTALERSGDFSQTLVNGRQVTIYDPLTARVDPATGQTIRDPFPGNAIPASRINPVARAMLDYLPTPTAGKLFNGNASLDDGPQNQKTIKLDQRWGAKWTTTAMYAHQYTKEPASAFFGDFGTNPADGGASMLYRTIDFLALNNIFIPDNSTAITVRYGWNRFYDDGGNYPEFDAASLGFPAAYVDALTFNTFPSVGLSGYQGFGHGGPSRTEHISQTANATMSKIVGHHTVKFGVDYRRISASVLAYGSSAGSFSFTQAFTQGPGANTASANAGDAFASFLLGYPASGSITVATPGHYFTDYYAGYVQDDYRVISTLTLNYGLRYEYEAGLRERDNHFTVGFDRDALFPVQVPGMTLKGGLMYAGVDGNSTHQAQPLNGVAPRGGFAWSLSEKSVLRGGYGFFWAPTQYPGTGEAAIGSRGYTAATTLLASVDGGLTPAGTLSNPFPSGFTPPQGNALGLLTGAGGVVDFVEQGSKPGYVQQYSLDFQREFSGGNVITIGFMGSRSERLSMGGTSDATVNINQLDPQYLSLGTALQQLVPNPFFGLAAFGNLSRSATIARGQLLRPYPQFDNLLAHRVNEASARYRALVLQWNKRMRHGYALNLNYTRSRLMDNQFGEGNTYSNRQGSALNNYDLGAEYGVSMLDVPQRLNLTAALQLPFGEGRRWLTRGGIANALVGGWSVAIAGRYQDGFPLNVWQSSNNSGLFGSNQRPNVVPGIDPNTSGSNEARLAQWINPAAFSAAPAFTLGNAPRTNPDLRGPGQKNTDLSLQKTQRLGGKTISVRADVLNLFDNPLFSGPVTTFGTGNFGLIDTVGGFARSVQLQARVGW